MRPRLPRSATEAVPGSVFSGVHPGGYASIAPPRVRATFQPLGGDAGFSQANGPDARPRTEPPQPARATNSAAATATAARPAVTRVRLIAQTFPSPSLGPPLLSESPSPPPF